MIGDHLYQQVRHELGQLGYEITDWFHKPRYPHNNQGDTVNKLVETIKADLAAAGHTVDQAVHDVLTHRLGIVSVLNYAADEMSRVQASPLAALAERYIGLDPAIAATVVHVADILATDGAQWLAGPAPAGPQPEPAPAA